MTITREQIDSLRVGDVVEFRDENHPDVVTRGPIREVSWLGPVIGTYPLLTGDGSVRPPSSYTMTVVSRAPVPLFTNSSRTRIVYGDVVRDAKSKLRVVAGRGDGGAWGLALWAYESGRGWVWQVLGEDTSIRPLTLLVDGETGLTAMPRAT